MGFWNCQSDFGDQKKHKSDPCLGSFLAILEKNQIMTIFFFESLAPLYCQKKKSKTYILPRKKKSNFTFGPLFHFWSYFTSNFFGKT